MSPFSQNFWVLEDACNMLLLVSIHHCLLNDLLPFLFFGQRRYHPIIVDIILDDFVNCWPGYADSFGYVGDWKPDGTQIPILTEPELYNLDLHWELDLSAMLEKFMKISDREFVNFWILLFQNLIVAVVLHFQIELLSFQLDCLDLMNFWNDELWEIIFSKHLHIIIIFLLKTLTPALERWKPFGSSLWTLNTLVYLQLIIQNLLAPWNIRHIFFLIHNLNGFYKATYLRNINILMILLLWHLMFLNTHLRKNFNLDLLLLILIGIYIICSFWSSSIKINFAILGLIFLSRIII